MLEKLLQQLANEFWYVFTDSNFSIPFIKGLQQTQTNFKMSAVQIYIVPKLCGMVKDHLNLEFGPVLQINGKLGVDKDDENNLLLDQPGLIAKDIVDVSKINANFYVGINGGFKTLEQNWLPIWFNNFFGNKNNDNVKLLGEKMKILD